MGAETVIAAVAIASAAASAGAAYHQSEQQNKAVDRAKRSQKRAATVQTAQLRERAEQKRLEVRRELARIKGRLQVASADVGVGFGGTYEALSRQAEFDFEANEDIINRNLRSQSELVSTGMQANFAELDSRVQNSLLNSFLGGIQGGASGIQIGYGVKNLTDPADGGANQPNYI